MNDAQTALLARLREIIEETPRSGAVNAAGRPLQMTQFERAVERRADDGPELVAYVKAKTRGRATSSYRALIEAKRSDLTVEALVGDEDTPWASEFSDADRAAARARLGEVVEAHRQDREAVESKAVEHDRRIMADVSARRVAKGKPRMTEEQEAAMLRDRAERRDAAK